jgi:hypothetical protein
MQKRSAMYGMVSLAIILFSIVFMFQISGENQRALMKGYLISFSYSHSCGGMVPVPRIYSRYYFTDDTLHNDSTLQAIQEDLAAIRQSYDSLHGVDITFSDSTPYACYLKVIAICRKDVPRNFFPFGDHIFASGISRHRWNEDSIILSIEHLSMIIYH